LEWLADREIAFVLELPYRMDLFAFKLLHEIAQLLLGHVRSGQLHIDEGIDDASEQSDREQQAKEAVTCWIFPHSSALSTGDLGPRLLAATAEAFDVHSCSQRDRLQKGRPPRLERIPPDNPKGSFLR
jgi:hypothetical protein